MNFHNIWFAIFSGSILEPVFPSNVSQMLVYACLLLRLLYDTALDAVDKPNLAGMVVRSPSYKKLGVEHKKLLDSPVSGKRSNVNSLNLNPPAPEPTIIHPGVVIAMLHLLPSIVDENSPELALSLQAYVAEVIKSLVRSERNQQVMCEGGMVGELLNMGTIALQDETHPLHQPLQYIIERLAAHFLEPRDLRYMFRI